MTMNDTSRAVTKPSRRMSANVPDEEPVSYVKAFMHTLMVAVVVLIGAIVSYPRVFGPLGPTMLAGAVSALGTIGVIDLVIRWDDKEQP